MIFAGNVIKSSGKIISAKPELSDKVVPEILKVDKSVYLHKGSVSPECTNIAIGQAIDFFYRNYEKLERKEEIQDFVARQLNNSREKVAESSVKFLCKYSG